METRHQQEEAADAVHSIGDYEFADVKIDRFICLSVCLSVCLILAEKLILSTLKCKNTV